jgi:hypothetical protein
MAVSLYDVLCVDPEATIDEIKSAFRKLALIHHPDKKNASANATVNASANASANATANANANANSSTYDIDEFAKIKLAYDTLSDTNKRAIYDDEQSNLANGNGNGNDNSLQNVSQGHWKTFMNDVMIKMFAMAACKTHINLTIDVPFIEVYQGKTKRIDIKTRQWVNGTYQYVQESVTLSLVNIKKKYVFVGKGDASVMQQQSQQSQHQSQQSQQSQQSPIHIHLQQRGDVVIYVNVVEFAANKLRIDNIFSEHDLFITEKVTLHDFYTRDTFDCVLCEGLPGVTIACLNTRQTSYLLTGVGLPIGPTTRSNVYINIELDIPLKLRTVGREKLCKVLKKYFN